VRQNNFKNPLTKLADKINKKVLSGVKKRIVKKSDNKELSKQGLTQLEQTKEYKKALSDTAKMGGAALTTAAVLGAGAVAGVSVPAKVGAKGLIGVVSAAAPKLKKAQRIYKTGTKLIDKAVDNGGQDELYERGIIPGENKNVTDQILDEVVNKPKNILDELISGNEKTEAKEIQLYPEQNNQKFASVY
jgi:hypothetical protein